MHVDENISDSCLLHASGSLLLLMAILFKSCSIIYKHEVHEVEYMKTQELMFLLRCFTDPQPRPHRLHRVFLHVARRRSVCGCWVAQA